jgi:hypothetical protein
MNDDGKHIHSDYSMPFNERNLVVALERGSSCKALDTNAVDRYLQAIGHKLIKSMRHGIAFDSHNKHSSVSKFHS